MPSRGTEKAQGEGKGASGVYIPESILPSPWAFLGGFKICAIRLSLYGELAAKNAGAGPKERKGPQRGGQGRPQRTQGTQRRREGAHRSWRGGSDEAATEEQVVLVEDGGLAGGHGVDAVGEVRGIASVG